MEAGLLTSLHSESRFRPDGNPERDSVRSRPALDTIKDFNEAEGDKIDLSALPGQFYFGGTHTPGDSIGANEVVVEHYGNVATYVWAQPSGGAEIVGIIIRGYHSLEANDFIL